MQSLLITCSKRRLAQSSVVVRRRLCSYIVCNANLSRRPSLGTPAQQVIPLRYMIPHAILKI